MPNTAATQSKTFANWMNEVLKERPPLKVENLDKDLSDGVLLCNLLEILTGGTIKFQAKPKVQAHHVENCAAFLKYLKENEKVTSLSLGPQNIVENNVPMILGLLWKLISKYHIKPQGQSEKSDVLEWVRKQIPDVPVKNLDSDWANGKALCALVNASSPGLFPNYQTAGGLADIKKAISIAESELGVPPVLTADIIAGGDLDELSLMTYLVYFRNKAARRKKSEGVTNGLYVQVVRGPKSNIRVDTDEFVHGLSYMPVGAGEFQIEITWKGQPIQGSPFTVKTT